MTLEWLKGKVDALAKDFKDAGEDEDALYIEEQAYCHILKFCYFSGIKVGNYNFENLLNDYKNFGRHWLEQMHDLHRKFFEGQLEFPIALDSIFKCLERSFHNISRSDFKK